MTHIPVGLVGLFIGGPLILIEIWLVYMVSVYTEKAESHLPKSTFVGNNISMWSHAGFIGKTMRNGYLTLVLAMPEICSRKGILELAEARQFPRRLKLILFISWGLCFIFTAAMMVVGAYVRYFK
ncbi:hypothetical protein D3C77_308100 [compost metagenome]|uniref:hypothetical protein n=1 Tax=Pseudomonas sp. 5 TaxID=1619949 RepID=UPI000698B2FD|nr:hypothetical protein [Pseudomonas sp. 5]